MLVPTALKLISNEIKGKQSPNELYPSFTSFEDLHSDEVLGYVPESPVVFLKGIFIGRSNDLLVAAIGQAIMQVARPKTLIAPLQLAHGVKWHHLFLSKFKMQTLHKLGFFKSYTEIQNYEKSAAVYQQDELVEVEPKTGEFLQWSADNVGRNLVTLDGKNTIHIIATLTPDKFSDLKIPVEPKYLPKK